MKPSAVAQAPFPSGSRWGHPGRVNSCYDTCKPSTFAPSTMNWSGSTLSFPAPPRGLQTRTLVAVTIENVQGADVAWDGVQSHLEPLYFPVADDVFQATAWPVQLMAWPRASGLALAVMAPGGLLFQDRAQWILSRVQEALGELDGDNATRPLCLASYEHEDAPS